MDLRPEFICTEVGGLVRATVILPLSVNADVRVASSQTSWSSEKNAIKDVAFESYSNQPLSLFSLLGFTVFGFPKSVSSFQLLLFIGNKIIISL